MGNGKGPCRQSLRQEVSATLYQQGPYGVKRWGDASFTNLSSRRYQHCISVKLLTDWFRDPANQVSELAGTEDLARLPQLCTMCNYAFIFVNISLISNFCIGSKELRRDQFCAIGLSI